MSAAQSRNDAGTLDLPGYNSAVRPKNEPLPGSKGIEYALGDLYATMNRTGETEQAFRREIAMFSGNLSAYSSLAVVLVLEKKYEAADTLFAEMAQKNPTRQAYLVAAETYEALGDTRTASQWRTRAAQAK